MDHNGRPVRVSSFRCSPSTEKDECIGTSLFHEVHGVFMRHAGQLARELVERPNHLGAGRCRQLCLQREATTFVEVPPRHRT
jgi:hypothetical protein